MFPRDRSPQRKYIGVLTTTIHLLFTFLIASNTFADDLTPKKNVVALIYGEKHIFSVHTPPGWVLDRRIALDMKLGSFFYPEEYLDKDEKEKTHVYMYAHGYDKESRDENLRDFIWADINNFTKKYPALSYAPSGSLNSQDGLTKGSLYIFINMGTIYKEEVAYMDAPDSIITIVFSSKSKDEYDKYHKDYEDLIRSFTYLGNDKTKVLDAIRKKNIKYDWQR